MAFVYDEKVPTPRHLQMPQRKALPLPATSSRTISPPSRAATSDRHVRSMRNAPRLTGRPVSLLFQRGIMMFSRLRNWCRKARLRPGFVCGGGACGSVASCILAARGGCKNSRLWASKVVGLVGLMTTLDVESLLGTYMVLLPSLFFRPELRRSSFLPVSLSA